MNAPASAPRIALISATPAAIGPAVAGLAAEFPAARPWNLLDDTLLADAAARGGVVPELATRMRRLIAYAVAGGARGVLLTCSLYGPLVTRVRARVPVLAPDTAAFEAALSGGHRRVLVLASFEAALEDSLARFTAAARAAGAATEAVGAVATGPPLDAARAYADEVDAVLLAQYSLAPHTEELAAGLGLPVHSGPQAAARALKSALAEGSSS
ncbi:hypothetical protein [Streptomyces iconiensis]|uniref:Asp/Glu racemase n=1 Tax=Streptomyces iconiensis TaxID=1384038 RepID=A0ABT7A0J6_9ACTN|nr:hypothetical protein [Streptomyces iconiensis]MDJ1134853.1 hypothetical protein [Streptomyces iconiensis]